MHKAAYLTLLALYLSSVCGVTTAAPADYSASNTVGVPSIPAGSNHPKYQGYPSPASSFWCPAGEVLSVWQLEAVELPELKTSGSESTDTFLGSVSALCSDGTQLGNLTYYYGSPGAECHPYQLCATDCPENRHQLDGWLDHLPVPVSTRLPACQFLLVKPQVSRSTCVCLPSRSWDSCRYHVDDHDWTLLHEQHLCTATCWRECTGIQVCVDHVPAALTVWLEPQ